MVDSFGAGTLVLDQADHRVGRYTLLEKLGEGAQGVVHRAFDPADGSIVAIKIVRTDRVNDPNVLRRFRKEARLMAEANNPFVVNLLEFNEDDGIPYMVLEFVAGNSLGNLLAERGRLAENEALSFMASVARGLMEAHERGIVHRDVKPSNILLLDSHQPAAGEHDEASSFKLKVVQHFKSGSDAGIRRARRFRRLWTEAPVRQRPGRGSKFLTSDSRVTSLIPNRWR